MTLGSRIRQLRKAHKLTQVQLAETVGVAQQLISGLENGKIKETAQIVKIARELGVTAEWLETGEGARDMEKRAAAGPAASEAEALRFTVASLFSLLVLARPREATGLAASMRRKAGQTDPDLLQDKFVKVVLAVLDKAGARQSRSRRG